MSVPIPPNPSSEPVLVTHKFGGSSVADAAGFRRVASILRTHASPRRIVVVSAMRGTTDTLIRLVESAVRADPWEEDWRRLQERHRNTVHELLAEHGTNALRWLEGSFATVAKRLHALAVLATPNPETLEAIQGLGELWSAHVLSCLLRQEGVDCALLDAREVLVVAHGETGAVVDWAETTRRFVEWQAGNRHACVVATGFIARTASGRPTVLGRNGSDHSAAIFAALGNAAELTIWGDTDGVLSADPRLVPEARPLPALSYDEACELAYFGARVLHPQTLLPAMARGLPVRIRNSFNPEHPGTRIGASPKPGAGEPPVKGISAMKGLAILTLEGSGMIGVPGTAERAFGALRRSGVSVVMISQGSSEHSICCVVRGVDAVAAENALRRAFEAEIGRREIQRIRSAADISVLAIVGDAMVGQPGVAARTFAALARTGINVRAIAQGASERNISVAIASHDAARALRAVHAAFWLSPQTLSIGLIGPGKVGAALLAQIEAARERLLREHQLDLRVRAIAARRSQWLGEAHAAREWQQNHLAEHDLAAFTRHVRAEHLPHAVIIDCSANSAIADEYAAWLAAGIHVITPNKHAGAGPSPRWQAIRDATASGARFRYEATVGAGLPVISTLRDLLDSGDELFAVEGIFSGTLAWLFNRYDGSQPFSALVREARALGYTEPDPRDDLSGVDVARKLVILAREAGRRIELGDIAIESLVPTPLQDVDTETFLRRLPELDAAMAERFAQASGKRHVLRHVARLDDTGRASVGLVALPHDHGFAHLRLTDNIVQFSTRRYRDNPLVVQGPGAGPEVTAAGVFGDLLRVAATLGARL